MPGSSWVEGGEEARLISGGPERTNHGIELQEGLRSASIGQKCILKLITVHLLTQQTRKTIILKGWYKDNNEICHQQRG